MGSFLAAIIAVVGIAFGSAFVLENFQSSADKSFQTGGVRLAPSEAADRTAGVPKKH